MCPFYGRRLRLFLLPLDLCLLWRHLRFAGHEMLGGCGERGGKVRASGFLWGMAAALGSDWGFQRFLAKGRLKAQFFPLLSWG
jgi:hypothetical protein